MMNSIRSSETDPKAPYVFTRRNGSKDAFICCFDDRRFLTTGILKNPMRDPNKRFTAIRVNETLQSLDAATAADTILGRKYCCIAASSKQKIAGIMVSQFRKLKFPEAIMTDWKIT
mmetsp:Transcript_31475/g.48182  ORF Transcript_31475/g.48182 Transcript_31475/m.48182 type:complete len:116 (+) Transcript_31475:160-507(+)